MTYNYNGKIRSTLEETLNEIDDTTIIAIGSASGFIFIGVKSDFYRDADALLERYNSRSPNNLLRHYNAIRTPYLTRKVTEMYWIKSSFKGEPIKLAILIEGRESGSNWFTHDYHSPTRKCV